MRLLAGRAVRSAAVALVAGGWLALAGPAAADTFDVNLSDDAADAAPGDGRCDIDRRAQGDQCTLRAAVMEANATPGADTVALGGGIYLLRRHGPSRWSGGEDVDDLDVRDDLRIEGAGPAATRILVLGAHRAIEVYGGVHFDLDGVTVSGGKEPRGLGGGLRIARGSLTRLRDVTVEGNTARFGGGIWSAALTLEGERVVVRGNKAFDRGGGIVVGGDPDHTGLTFRKATIADNVAVSGDGGGIQTRGVTFLYDSEVTGNHASRGGGGLAIAGRGEVLLSGVRVDRNRARSGGGVRVTDEASLVADVNPVSGPTELTRNAAIEDGGAVYSDSGGGIPRLQHPALDPPVQLIGTLVQFNVARRTGGALFLSIVPKPAHAGGALLRDAHVYGNSARRDGGAIAVEPVDSVPRVVLRLSLETTDVWRNRAGGGGGGISVQSATGAGFADVSVARSTFRENTAGTVGGGLRLGVGARDALVDTSTLSANRASAGGGAYVEEKSRLTLASSTVAANAASAGAGIVVVGVALVRNSIVVGATGEDACLLGGSLESDGPNLFGDDSCPASADDLVGVDPLLQPLDLHGGPTPVHALAPSSPAVDAGSSCGPLDQRGLPRPAGTACDIGAFELAVLIEPPTDSP